MSIAQTIKNKLVTLGPKNILTQTALKLYGCLHGYKIIFKDDVIISCKNNQQFIINQKDLMLAPMLVSSFKSFFKTIIPKQIDDQSVLDFSKPGVHRYKQYDISFVFPGIAEDDSMSAYDFKFKPTQGMIVFDVGAHAGFTTYFFSQMVGVNGKVYAFEPDDISREYLNDNIKDKNLNNVEILDVALGARSGKEMFYMNGAIGASLVESSTYCNIGIKKEVTVFTLEDFCNHIGVIPDFIKIDIEGAETGVIANSLEFLKKHPIHFAIESNHKTKNGTLTCHQLDKLFQSIGYSVESSDRFDKMFFTWATPPDALQS